MREKDENHSKMNKGNAPVMDTLEKVNMTGPVTPEAANLHRACLAGDEESVKMLLSQGASLTAVDEDGFNALLFATKSNNVDLVQQLLDAGANVDFVDEEFFNKHPATSKTALHVAIENGNVEMLECLLKNKADPNRISGSPGVSALFFAAKGKLKNRFDMMKLLLSHGADMYTIVTECETKFCQFSTSFGPFTLFEYLVANNRVAEARILLENGLDLARFNPQDPNNFSPLHEALWDVFDRRKDDKAMLSLLLEYNAKKSLNIDHVNKSGYTPLCYAALNSLVAHVKLLLNAGANVNFVTSGGSTPLELAVSPRCIFHPICIELLVEAGAKLRNVLEELLANTPVDEMSDDDESEIEIELGIDEELEQIQFQPVKNDRFKNARYRLQKAKCIVRNRVLYESHNSSIPDPIENANMGGSIKLLSYYKACKSEIIKLKNFNISNSITYYDVLADYESFYKRVRNDEVYESVDEKKIESDFPLYAEDLIGMLECSKDMHERWEKAVKKMSEYLKLDSDVYYLILCNILGRLNFNDLKSISES